MTQPALQGKRILVTGAAAGIGLGIARACANAGASLVVGDIDYERLISATEPLGTGPQDVYAVKLDVSRRQPVRELFGDLENRFGRIDGLVNNAGITIESDFFNFSEEDLEKLWTTNLRSVFFISQQAALHMKERGGGSILNISSVHERSSIPGYEMYAATKGGITAMARAMSWSLGPHGIRVNNLSPGLTLTEEVRQAMKDHPELAGKFAALHATGKFATVDEVGAVAAFLLSDAASAITGANIIVDHGAAALLHPSDALKAG